MPLLYQQLNHIYEFYLKNNQISAKDIYKINQLIQLDQIKIINNQGVFDLTADGSLIKLLNFIKKIRAESNLLYFKQIKLTKK